MKRKTATSPIPSPKKRAAKAQPDVKATVVDRLLAVKRAPLVPPLIAAAALARRTPQGKRIATLEADMERLQSDIERVAEIRARLADVPALSQQASIL
jgi:hypothetical protein